MPIYSYATVCARGHIIARDRAADGESDFCTTCGAPAVRECSNCEHDLVGPERVYDAMDVALKYHWEPPNFCQFCGAAFPWVDRAGRIHELENRLHLEELPPAEELAVRELLQALREPGLSDDEQRKRWQRILDYAPGLRDTAGDLIRSVATAAVLKGLGL